MGKKRSEKRVEKKRVNKWHCIHCSKHISPNEQQVVMVTKLNSKIIQEVYFHFQCWIDYFNERVSLKAKANVEQIRNQTLKLLDNPMIAEVLSQVQGSGTLMSMLRFPLSNDQVISKNRVKKKIENGRKKRSGKKAKNKM